MFWNSGIGILIFGHSTLLDAKLEKLMEYYKKYEKGDDCAKNNLFKVLSLNLVTKNACKGGNDLTLYFDRWSRLFHSCYG